MSVRWFLLPGGTWTLLARADAGYLPDGTIMLDPWTPNPGHRVRRITGGSWAALSELEVDELYAASLEVPANYRPPLRPPTAES